MAHPLELDLHRMLQEIWSDQCDSDFTRFDSEAAASARAAEERVGMTADETAEVVPLSYGGFAVVIRTRRRGQDWKVVGAV